jgi:hypothetical protein
MLDRLRVDRGRRDVVRIDSPPWRTSLHFTFDADYRMLETDPTPPRRCKRRARSPSATDCIASMSAMSTIGARAIARDG